MHIAKENLVEEVRITVLQAIEVDIFFETSSFATELVEAAFTMVSVHEKWRKTGNRHGTHRDTGERRHWDILEREE